GLNVGQWRDSEMGLAYGRVPFDVNAALVPAALEAAAALYARLGDDERAARASRYREAWRGALELFRIRLPLATARERVAGFARAAGLRDTSRALTAGADGKYSFYGVALDAQGRPLPVQHSDHGFVLAFTDPPSSYLESVAATVGAEYPAGLVSPVGLVVASPALAPDFGVAVPDAGGARRAPLRELFSPAQYHGTVVWSWQQALFARGLRRQLERADLGEPARGALERLECRLWAA